MTQASEDQIKALRQMLKEIDTLEAGDKFERFVLSRRKEALTAILADFHEMREMLDAFQMGTFIVDGNVLVIVPSAGGFKIGDGSDGDDRRFDSALDAFAAVKKGEGKQ